MRDEGTQLTPRELEVMELARLTDKQIAVVLNCSPKTVSCHWEHIRKKMGVASKMEAALDWHTGKLA